jgi:hypothetical protein
MILVRPSWSIARIALGLGCLLASAPPARAQTFVELGGGWNHVSPAPSGDSYGPGFNARASIGRQLAPHFLVRLDAFTISGQSKDSVQFYPPCAFPGCTRSYYNYTTQSFGIAGLTVNGLVNVDSRGIFYAIGGAGIYDVSRPATELHLGVSAGAGIAVPLGARLRAVVEARWHGLLGATAGPPWLVPITVGLRW